MTHGPALSGMFRGRLASSGPGSAGWVRVESAGEGPAMRLPRVRLRLFLLLTILASVIAATVAARMRWANLIRDHYVGYVTVRIRVPATKHDLPEPPP
jgi:hypothetical protein